MAVIVSNPKRGCGTKKQNGFYLGAPASEDGTLASAWCLGSHVEGGDNFYATRVPSRGCWTFNPAVSLAGGELVTEPGDFHDHHLADSDDHRAILRRVGGYPALIDYVGADNYTPRTFADEVFRLGPSRRVSFATARAVAAHLPVPIFFAATLPLFNEDHYLPFLARVEAAQQTDEAREVDSHFTSRHIVDTQETALTDPLWRVPGWGLLADDARGHAHFMARAIRWAMLDDDLSAFRTTARTIFFASWITQSVWIAPTLHDALNPPPSVFNAGIEVGVLEGTPEADAYRGEKAVQS